MNTITRISILIAAVCVAVFALNDSSDVAVRGVVQTSSVDANVASPMAPLATADAAGERQETTVGLSPTIYATAGSPDVLASAQTVKSEAADEPRTEQERKERIAQSKMSGPVAALAAVGGPTPTEIIVSYAGRPELVEDERIEKLGGEIVRHYEILELLAIRIPADALVELAIDDSVERVSLDDAVQSSSVASKQAAKLPAYPSGNTAYSASGVLVAVLDSGVAYHPDLAGSVIQLSFLNGAWPNPEVDDGEIDDNTDPLVDAFGHGTHIAGIIGGSGKYSDGDFFGPARRAEIISLQVLDENGYGKSSDVMAALEWLMKYGPYLDIGVANLSLGKPITESNTTDPLVRAVEQLWDRGIVVTVAAGNFGREGYFSTTSPGNSRKVITVGSVTDNGTGNDFSDDYTSTYSSKGPTAEDHVVKPDLVAPGNRLVATTPVNSTLATLLPNNKVNCLVATQCNYNYLELSGTSMATGMVTATVAMMLQKDPSLSPATVKARLMRSARKLDESPIVAGAGVLDIDAAMNDNGIVSGQALSPLMAYDTASGGTIIQDTAALWGSDIWGAGYLWTDGGVNANGYLWTDGVNASGYLWTDGVNANGYIWTDGGVFANGYLWTDGGVAAFGYLWTDGVNASGYLWTDGGGVDSNGYLWTDGVGVDSNGYLWTDGGVGSNGYLWTDGVNANALYDLFSANPALNDDEPTSN